MGSPLSRLFRTIKAKFGWAFALTSFAKWIVDFYGRGEIVREWIQKGPQWFHFLSEPWTTPLLFVVGIGLVIWANLERGGSVKFDNLRWLPERYREIKIPHEYIVGGLVILVLILVGILLHHRYSVSLVTPVKIEKPSVPAEKPKEVLPTKPPPNITQAIPSSYVQTFDAGPCDAYKKPYIDTAHGVFTRIDTAVRDCEDVQGRRAVIHFPPLYWSSVYVTGLTPTKHKGKKMLVTLRWFVEWGTDLTNKHIVWDISRSCGEDDNMQLIASTDVAVREPPKIADNTPISADSCAAGEKYSIRIARNDKTYGTLGIASLVEAQVDLR